MGAFGKICFAVIILSVAIKWFYFNKSEQKLLPPSEEAWWGPGTPNFNEETEIRPFQINVSDSVLEDLNRRLDQTRSLTPPLEGIQFQYGFNTKTLQKILSFWRTEYKWRQREEFLNSLPQFKTKIQGLDIHYIHVKPKVKKTVPLLLVHGWPGSVREFYSLIPLLSQAQEGANFAFEIIAPSLPGYGFSSPAARPGLGPAQMAVIFAKLMFRLGHQQFYIQGGDWGSQIASYMGVYYPQRVKGLHLNMCTVVNLKTRALVALGSIWPEMFVSEDLKDDLYPFLEKTADYILETGYLHIQATKPDTVGVGLSDSPAGLAAYILEKFSTATNRKYREVEDGGLLQQYTYTDLLDNVMIYWITNSITTSMRLYAENFAKNHRALNLENTVVDVPTWCSKFKTELGLLPDWILRLRYPKLQQSFRHNFGGHFAAFEQPSTLAQDIWRSFIQAEQKFQ